MAKKKDDGKNVFERAIDSHSERWTKSVETRERKAKRLKEGNFFRKSKAQRAAEKIAKNKKQYDKQTRKKFENSIKKAEDTLAEMNAKVEAMSDDLSVRKHYSTAKIQNELNKMKERLDKKGGLTYTQFVRLKDLKSKSWYAKNMIEIQVDVPVKTMFDVEVTKSEWIKLSTAESVAKKEWRLNLEEIEKGSTDKELTAREQAILRQFSAAISDIANVTNTLTFEPDEAIPATEADVIAKLKEQRGTGELDLSFGGHSALLNDLHYTAITKGNFGKDFVTWIRAIMENDKVMFARIERWYQSSEGYEARVAISNASGDQWYENFKSFAKMVEKVMSKLQIDLDIAPDSFSEDIMNEAEQRIAGYADGLD